MTTSDVRANTDQILMLERGALDRWGKRDPGGLAFHDMSPEATEESQI